MGVGTSLTGMGLEGTAIIDLQESSQVQKLLACCDHGTCLDGDDTFLEYWGGIRDALKEIARGVTNTAAVPR